MEHSFRMLTSTVNRALRTSTVPSKRMQWKWEVPLAASCQIDCLPSCIPIPFSSFVSFSLLPLLPPIQPGIFKNFTISPATFVDDAHAHDSQDGCRYGNILRRIPHTLDYEFQRRLTNSKLSQHLLESKKPQSSHRLSVEAIHDQPVEWR